MTAVAQGAHAAPATKAPAKRTRIVELDESFGPLCDEFADVKLTFAEADSRKKQITEELKAAAGMNEDTNEVLVVKVGGVIRHKIRLQVREGVDLEKLRDAYPEAFEACKTETEYQVVAGA